TCAITVNPIFDNVRRIELDAVDLEIGDVRLEGGGALDFTYDGRKLRIAFAKELPKGQKQTLVIGYGAQPRRGLYFIAPDRHHPRRPRQVWSQGQDEDSRHWFPCFDAPHEKSTSEVIADVPPSFTAVSNGALVNVHEAPSGKTYHFKFDVPHSCY